MSFFKKNMSCFEARNILHTFSSVSWTFHREYFERTLREFVFVEFKKKKVFCANHVAEETPNLILHKVYSLRCFLLLLLLQGKYIVSVAISDERLHYELGRK